jgi:hypothetical protein
MSDQTSDPRRATLVLLASFVALAAGAAACVIVALLIVHTIG